MPPREWERVVGAHVKAMTPHSLTTRPDLERDRVQIRELGWALSREDVSLHAAAVGAPVRDHSGQVVAAVSVSGIVQRFDDDHLPALVDAVGDAAGELSLRMGYEAAAAEASP